MPAVQRSMIFPMQFFNKKKLKASFMDVQVHFICNMHACIQRVLDFIEKRVVVIWWNQSQKASHERSKQIEQSLHICHSPETFKVNKSE